MGFLGPIRLGQTGLKAGCLGLGAGYGAPSAAYEAAFERGCNYFYWTSRKKGMRQAIRHLCKQGRRDQLIIAVQTYARHPLLMEFSIRNALKRLGIGYADILILGWHNTPPSNRLTDQALRLKERGLFSFLGVSGHHRALFPALSHTGLYDVFHIRYNAAHRGAERDVFPFLAKGSSPGIVTYTATRWGHLLKARKTPPGEKPLSAIDCYRFALSHPSVDICLCGPRNFDQMQTALKTLETDPLSESEMMRIRKIGDYVRANSGRFY